MVQVTQPTTRASKRFVDSYGDQLIPNFAGSEAGGNRTASIKTFYGKNMTVREDKMVSLEKGTAAAKAFGRLRNLPANGLVIYQTCDESFNITMWMFRVEDGICSGWHSTEE